jgi:hypothetical protein
MERPRSLNTAKLDPLDSIVAEVFQSLAEGAPTRNGETIVRRLRSRDDSVRLTSKPPLMRRDKESVEAPVAPKHRNEATPIAQMEVFAASEFELDDVTDMARSAPAPIAMSASDQAFLDGAVAFLRSRPNPELLLELLWMSIVGGQQIDVTDGERRTASEPGSDTSPACDDRKDP